MIQEDANVLAYKFDHSYDQDNDKDNNDSTDNDKCYDEKYKAKRIANTKSVRLHREMNPKMRYLRATVVSQ